MPHKLKYLILTLLLAPSLVNAQRGTGGWDMNEGDDISILFWFWGIILTITVPMAGYSFFKEAESFYEKLVALVFTISFGVFWINLLGFIEATSDIAEFIASIFGQNISESFLVWGFIICLISIFMIRKINSQK